MLQGYQPNAQDVAYQQAAAYYKDGKPQERAAHHAVARAESLKHADHRRALEDDDEQARHHSEARHAEHEGKDYPDVKVEQVEPGEYLRIGALYGFRRVCLAVLVDGAVHTAHKLFLNGVDAAEVGHAKLCPAGLVGLPAVQAHCGVKVGEAQRLVKLRQVGLVNAGNSETPRPYVAVVDEVGEHLVARAEPEAVGHYLGDEQLAAAHRVAEGGNGAAHQVVVDERRVILGGYALEGHAEKVVVGLKYPLLHGEALHVTDAADGAQHGHHAVRHAHWPRLAPVQGHEVAYGDVAAEAHHLVAYGVLEAEHYGDRHYHHGKPYGYARRGYSYGGAAHLTPGVARRIDAARDKQR